MHHHRFFDDEERREWQNPELILKKIGVKPGFTFIDIGCGEGFFALPAARLVGEKGKVYALDIDDEAVERLEEKAAQENLRNLVLKVGEAEDTILCEKCADIVFYGIVLHDFASPEKVLANAQKMIKPDGRLVDVDWKKKPMELGPPLRIRFSEAQAVELIERAGFKIGKIEPSGLYHYIIVARS